MIPNSIVEALEGGPISIYAYADGGRMCALGYLDELLEGSHRLKPVKAGPMDQAVTEGPRIVNLRCPIEHHHPLLGREISEAAREHLRHCRRAPLAGGPKVLVPVVRSSQGIARMVATLQPGPKASIDACPFSRVAKPCSMKRLEVIRSTQLTQ